MLHIREIEMGKSDKNIVRLEWNADVEDTFREIVKKDKKAFHDTESQKLMAAIDQAKIVGEYSVKTPLQTSCITCLCTGGKAGLLVLYYNRKGIIPYVSYYVAGKNVWDWLNKYTETYIMVKAEELWCFPEEDRKRLDDIWDRQREIGKYFYELSKEKEAKAYERYIKEKRGGPANRIFCNIQEEISVRDFMKRFSDWERMMQIAEEEGLPLDYHVVNSSSVLWQETSNRKIPVYCIGKKNGSKEQCYESRCILTVKYATFLEMLYCDLLNVFYDSKMQGHRSFEEAYEEWYCLPLNCEERCNVWEYTDDVLCGLMIKPKEKLIRIYSIEEAIEKFHELYQKKEVRNVVE